MNFTHFLGYDQGPNGEFIINPEQAETVKLIYRLFLSGLTPHAICKELMKRGIKSPAGKPTWWQGTVESILTNEKYKGDALLQKYYTKDYLTHKQVRNTGEIPQYYVEDHHEAIIDDDTFERVQTEMARRKKCNEKYSGCSIFASKIKCGDCGGWYGSKVWHSNSKYRKTIFQCNRKFKNEQKCTTPHLVEEEIKQAFIKAVNVAIVDKDELIRNAKIMMEMVCDSSILKEKEQHLLGELDILVEQIQKIVHENSKVAMNQEEYQARYEELEEKYNRTKEEYDKTVESINKAREKEDQFKSFIRTLENTDGAITEFDEAMWCSMVESMTVYRKDNIVFALIGGMEVTVSLEDEEEVTA